MKNLKTFVMEACAKKKNCKKEEEECEEEKANESLNEAEETIDSEESFKSYAENKFKKVFGDKVDKDKMDKIVNGIIKDNKEAVDKGDWGKLIGILNKSF